MPGKLIQTKFLTKPKTNQISQEQMGARSKLNKHLQKQNEPIATISHKIDWHNMFEEFYLWVE